MLFDEKEMLEICRKYGISVVERTGLPLFMGEEMDLDFNVSEIMNDGCEMHTETNFLLLNSFEMSINDSSKIMHYSKNCRKALNEKIGIHTSNDDEYRKITSTIPENSDASFAA